MILFWSFLFFICAIHSFQIQKYAISFSLVFDVFSVSAPPCDIVHNHDAQFSQHGLMQIYLLTSKPLTLCSLKEEINALDECCQSKSKRLGYKIYEQMVKSKVEYSHMRRQTV